MRSVPARLDRYPGKMVGHLAEKLVDRYAGDAKHLVDPFCGSGAILRAGSAKGVRVTGVDINPFGVLLSRVKIEGFDVGRARALCEDLIGRARGGRELPMQWNNKTYWFGSGTLRQFQQLRFAARGQGLNDSRAGRAVLLALGLSVRPCSWADQRSPKPFISRVARDQRKGRHFDPTIAMREVLQDLGDLYGVCRNVKSNVLQLNIVDGPSGSEGELACSHVITSPPYVNAQDYFRNSKLELYVLEKLLPFRIDDIIHRFVGTERRLSRSLLRGAASENRRMILPELGMLEMRSVQKAAVVHRYLRDMEAAFLTIRGLLQPNGTLVVVCGDNLVGGIRIVTWKALNLMLNGLGFEAFDRFDDRIRNRALAPQRKGHKGLIKQEVVSAFRLPGTDPWPEGPRNRVTTGMTAEVTIDG